MNPQDIDSALFDVYALRAMVDILEAQCHLTPEAKEKMDTRLTRLRTFVNKSALINKPPQNVNYN